MACNVEHCESVLEHFSEEHHGISEILEMNATTCVDI